MENSKVIPPPPDPKPEPENENDDLINDLINNGDI